MNILWQIEWMRCVPQVEGVENLVVECGWRATASDGPHSATAYGSCIWSQPESAEGFVPYAELTEDQVLGWVYGSGVDRTATEAALQRQLADLINPPIVQPALPWANSTESHA